MIPIFDFKSYQEVQVRIDIEAETFENYLRNYECWNRTCSLYTYLLVSRKMFNQSDLLDLAPLRP